MHDKIKYQAGLDSAFSQVLNNVNDILIENQDISISLRINYTHESLDKKIIADINSIIDPSLRNRIKITPRKVWQIKADKSFSPVLVEILDEFEQSGYTVQRWNPSTTFYSCYTNKEYYNAINYNGNVVKCTACDDLYSKDPLGLLLPNGRIK